MYLFRNISRFRLNSSFAEITPFLLVEPLILLSEHDGKESFQNSDL